MHLRAMALASTAAFIGMLAFAVPASAHITVSAPGATKGGLDTVITFRVPTESAKALIAGSNTGSTYILEFMLTSPTKAIAFDFNDVAETGNFLLAQPDTGVERTIATCCSGPYEGFGGYVAKKEFTRFYLISTGRNDGLGIDRIQIGRNKGKP